MHVYLYLILNETGTQADQSRVDEEQKKKAMKDLVTSWQDRLQLISVIVSLLVRR